MDPSVEDSFQKRNLSGIYLPLFFSGTKKVVYHRVVRLLSHESSVLNSRDRVKKFYYIHFQIKLIQKFFILFFTNLKVPYILYLETIAFEEDEDKPNKHSLYHAPVDSTAESKLLQALERIVSLKREINERHSHSSEESDWVLVELKSSQKEDDGLLSIAYPEPWEQKQKRFQKTSPFGMHPNWNILFE